MSSETLGALAAALVKAQAAFPVITRDKKVTVKTKTGGSYEFAYAPLDQILAAVRDPLGKQGLAVSQLIDGDALVTLLLHESGEYLEGRTPLPESTDIQGFGSAITYLRRYALQAMLGIAAEEDDDGSRASGQTINVKPDVERGEDGSLIGTALVGDRPTSDFEVHNTPDGPVLGFRLRGERGGILVRSRGQLARDLYTLRDAVIGHRVTVWGKITTETFTPAKKGAAQVSYEVLDAVKVSVPGLPPLPTKLTESAPAPDVASEPMFDELERIGG